MDLECRVMKDIDFAGCAKELTLAFKGEPWNENWTYEQAYTRISEIMSSKESRGYIITCDKEIVSMLSGRIMTYLDYKEFWIDEFSVSPSFQRQGLGSKMLEFVKSELEKENIFKLILNTKRGYPSVKFYEKNGFKIDNSLVFMVNNFKDI